MSTPTCDGTTVAVKDEGFLTNPDQWTPDIAVAIARESGIDELTDRRWRVIDFMRAEYAAKGTGPTPGIPKPRGCI